MRAGHFDKERCFADDMLGITYGIRGIQTSRGKWEHGALTMDEIEALKTPFLFQALHLYKDFNVFEMLPHGKGTLDEKPTITEIISILREEENSWQAWENEKRSK